MRRTLQAMMASVQRACQGANVPLGDIHKAIDTSYKDVESGYDWPWTYTETNIIIDQTYTTGTISITNHTNVVTGLGTTWDVTWTGRRLRVGSSNVDYIVTSVVNPTSLLLAQAVNLGANITNSAYFLYQDTFYMPSDFAPGQDIFIGQPEMRVRVKHIPRVTLEQQSLVLKQLQTNLTSYYADGPYDEVNGLYSIRFMPTISGPGQYRLTYRKVPADLTALIQTTHIPPGYDEVLELLAEARVKTTYNIPGAEQAQAKAASKLRMLRKQIATANVDTQSILSGTIGDSAFSQGGLSVFPWS
jgi:hypothetical protein